MCFAPQREGHACVSPLKEGDACGFTPQGGRCLRLYPSRREMLALHPSGRGSILLFLKKYCYHANSSQSGIIQLTKSKFQLILLRAFEDQGHAHTTADTKGGQAKFVTAASHLMQQGDYNPGTCGTDWVPKADTAAVNIDNITIQLQ